jgi:hypothetical protein
MFQILHNIKNKVIMPPPPPTTTTTTSSSTRMHNKSSVSFDETNVTQTLSSRTASLPPPSPPPSPTRDGTSPKLPRRVPFGNNGGEKTQQQQQEQEQSSSPQKSRSQSQSLHSRDESLISVSSNKTSLTSPKLRSNLMREQKERDPLFFYEVVKTLGVGSMVRTPFRRGEQEKKKQKQDRWPIHLFVLFLQSFFSFSLTLSISLLQGVCCFSEETSTNSRWIGKKDDPRCRQETKTKQGLFEDTYHRRIVSFMFRRSVKSQICMEL